MIDLTENGELTDYITFFINKSCKIVSEIEELKLISELVVENEQIQSNW
jgi:hypothetical protein